MQELWTSGKLRGIRDPLSSFISFRAAHGEKSPLLASDDRRTNSTTLCAEVLHSFSVSVFKWATFGVS